MVLPGQVIITPMWNAQRAQRCSERGPLRLGLSWRARWPVVDDRRGDPLDQQAEVRALAAELLQPLSSGLSRSDGEGVTVSVWLQCDGPAQTCRKEKLTAIPSCLSGQRALRAPPDPRAAAINDRLERLFGTGL